MSVGLGIPFLLFMPMEKIPRHESEYTDDVYSRSSKQRDENSVRKREIQYMETLYEQQEDDAYHITLY